MWLVASNPYWNGILDTARWTIAKQGLLLIYGCEQLGVFEREFIGGDRCHLEEILVRPGLICWFLMARSRFYVSPSSSPPQ